jgi:riboflavin biosynthesis pyrimidine reductase
VAAESREIIEASGIELWGLPEANGHLDWQAFRERCKEADICGVYLEVGPSLATSVIENQLADYLFIYQAPKLMSDAAAPGLGSLRNSKSMDEVFALRSMRMENYGEDRLTRGFIER